MKEEKEIKRPGRMGSYQTDVSSLTRVLSQLHPLPEGVVRYLSLHCREEKIAKKTVLVRSGEICNNIYFITKGLIRGYIREGIRDITTWMTAENELVTSISSLAGNEAAGENIQTVEDCELLRLSYAHLEQLYIIFPEFNITIRKLLQQYYLDAENRALIARLSKAESRYLHFLKRHGHLANRAPVKYIASFLGLTHETISRVRKKLSREGEQ
jgi:CRP-like cAMP-binding protein